MCWDVQLYDVQSSRLRLGSELLGHASWEIRVELGCDGCKTVHIVHQDVTVPQRVFAFGSDVVPKIDAGRYHLQRGHQRLREGLKATTGAASVAGVAAPRPPAGRDHLQRGH